jgi:hypothetical protein
MYSKIKITVFYRTKYDIFYDRMGIVIAARAVYRAGKAMAVSLHSPKPAQYVVVITESRPDPWPKKMTGGSRATFPRLASRFWMDRREHWQQVQF